METLDYQPTLKKPERPFGLQNFLAIGAGPCTVSPRVLNALVTPVLQPFNADLVQVKIKPAAILVAHTVAIFSSCSTRSKRC